VLQGLVDFGCARCSLGCLGVRAVRNDSWRRCVKFFHRNYPWPNSGIDLFVVAVAARQQEQRKDEQERKRRRFPVELTIFTHEILLERYYVKNNEFSYVGHCNRMIRSRCNDFEIVREGSRLEADHGPTQPAQGGGDFDDQGIDVFGQCSTRACST
jgi:hypothetical protein